MNIFSVIKNVQLSICVLDKELSLKAMTRHGTQRDGSAVFRIVYERSTKIEID